MVSLGMILALLLPSLTGCLWGDSPEPEPPPPGPFDFEEQIPLTTYYHYANQTNVTDMQSSWANLTDNNTPFWSLATYYGIGETTFEPTIGVTSQGSLFMTSWGGLGRGTHIIRSQDQGKSWEDIGPVWPGTSIGVTPSSNDPYLYVDPYTDRLVKFDMHALTTMFFEYSDNEGNSFSPPFPATGAYTPQDHQTIASAPPPAGFPHPILHPTIYVFCINTGAQGPIGAQCDSSFDGGHTWEGQVPGHPASSQCAGLSAHLVGASDGTFYRGNPACEGPAAYRSLDGGRTWTEHVIATTTPSSSHEIALGVDAGNNVHALWIGEDLMPWYSNSKDRGDTWSTPVNVALPGVTGTGFPTIAGGADGRVVFAYIGQNGNGPWSGYMGIMTDAFADNPLITTVAINAPDDPLNEEEDCGYRRCGGFGDFIDIVIDVEGRPWVAMAHDVSGQIGIAGTLVTGPALRGPLQPLPPIEAGGPDTLG
jgi:hypothetical protein